MATHTALDELPFNASDFDKDKDRLDPLNKFQRSAPSQLDPFANLKKFNKRARVLHADLSVAKEREAYEALLTRMMSGGSSDSGGIIKQFEERHPGPHGQTVVAYCYIELTPKEDGEPKEEAPISGDPDGA